MVGELLGEALRYPLRRADALVTGWTLTLLAAILTDAGLWPLGLVAVVLVAGYDLRVISSVARAGGASDRPPAFSDWRQLLTDGVRGIAVSVAYLAVPTLALVVTLAGLPGVEQADSGGPAAPLVLLLGTTVILVVALAFGFVLPAALAALATDGLRAAFRTGRLRSTVHRTEYLTGWVVAVGLLGVGGALAWWLLVTSRLTAVVGLLVAFVVQISVVQLVGVSVRESTESVDSRTDTPDSSGVAESD